MEISKQDTICSMFYNEHISVNDIATKVDTSSAYITKVIKQDERYIEEKQFRKGISKQKRKMAQNKHVKTKREIRRIEDNYQFVQTQHLEASHELSKSSHLTNENYRKWNYSAYSYNPSKRRYEFDERLRSFC